MQLITLSLCGWCDLQMEEKVTAVAAADTVADDLVEAVLAGGCACKEACSCARSNTFALLGFRTHLIICLRGGGMRSPYLTKGCDKAVTSISLALRRRRP